MKKILLIALVAISFIVKAQNIKPACGTYHLLSIEENHSGRWENEIGNHNRINPLKDYENEFRNQSTRQILSFQLLDSAYFWKWDPILAGWTLYSKNIDLIYDSNNNNVHSLSQNLNGSEWVNVAQTNSIYDNNNNQTDYIVQLWDGLAWVNNYRSISTFDADNNRLTATYFSWNGTAWTGSSNYIYSYDAANNQVSALRQSWTGSDWKDYYLDTFTYDGNHNRLSDLQQNWNGSTWDNNSLITYAYNTGNHRTSELDQAWSSGAWENVSLYTYSYDANSNLTLESDPEWDGAAWVNSAQHIFSFDANNNRVSELYETWNGSTWDNFIQYDYAFDDNNNEISGLVQIWNGINWVIARKTLHTWNADNYSDSRSARNFDDTGTLVMSGDSAYLFYHTITGINDLNNENIDISVYPNPGNGHFTLSSILPMTGIAVYNIFGQRVYADNTKTPSLKDIDLSDQGKGIYFVHVLDGKKTYTRKIIIQ